MEPVAVHSARGLREVLTAKGVIDAMYAPMSLRFDHRVPA
jgi:hypothetical protein